jgi:hypothetical protein
VKRKTASEASNATMSGVSRRATGPR